MLRKYQGETLRPDLPCPSRPLPHDLVTGGIPHAGSQQGVPSQVCRVSLLGSWSLAATLLVDVDHPESQEVLVSNEASLQFGRWCLSGAAIAPFWLSLPSPACLWWGNGPVCSRLALLFSPLFCERAWRCLRLGLFAFLRGSYPKVWVPISS